MNRVLIVLFLSFAASFCSFSNNVDFGSVVGGNLDNCNNREQRLKTKGCLPNKPADAGFCANIKRTYFEQAAPGETLNVLTTEVPLHCDVTTGHQPGPPVVQGICTGGATVPVLDPLDPTKVKSCATQTQQ